MTPTPGPDAWVDALGAKSSDAIKEGRIEVFIFVMLSVKIACVDSVDNQLALMLPNG
jgi:hypothetical protein